MQVRRVMDIQNKQIEVDTGELLKSLIQIPSYSGEEENAADFLETFLQQQGLNPFRKHNNVWVFSEYFAENKMNILLNGHIDTVKPSNSWSFEPHHPVVRDHKIVGLGSNDAGASLVCLLAAFIHFSNKDLPVNLIFSATAEEETGGANGIQSIIDDLPDISLGIIGEPTGMRLAVGEKGLLVVDARVTGTVSHAANENPDNAILKAISELGRLQEIFFEKTSDFLGKVHVTVSEIHAGTQHNVTPSECRFVLDIRLNERYSPQEVLSVLKSKMNCTLVPRSLDKKASCVAAAHPVIRSAKALNIECYGSPTLSNMAYVPFSSVKIGPGDSARSHQPDEYIYTNELDEGTDGYIQLINQYISQL